MINTTVRKVVFRSHFVKCKCHGPPPCACKFRLHTRACLNIDGVQRHASLVTSKIGPVKITHCDQRKRHVGISNILNQTNYSNELDAKRTSEYSVNSFQHYLILFYRYRRYQKLLEIEKRDCAWGCARGINTTWENLQIEKHKSVRWAERTPSWFVLFDLKIFSGGDYPPSATSRTISLFYFQ